MPEMHRRIKMERGKRRAGLDATLDAAAVTHSRCVFPCYYTVVEYT